MSKSKFQSVVKFKTNFVSREAVNDERVNELKKWCEIFRQQGLTPVENGFSCGNLSFRTEDDKNEFIITASGVSAELPLNNESFAKVLEVDLDKMIIKAQGVKEPSSESMLHAVIYQVRPEVDAIFHGHCQEILSAAGKLGLKETRQEESYGSRELAERVLEVLEKNDIIVMKNHGFLSLGQSMGEAGQKVLNVLEECCKIMGR